MNLERRIDDLGRIVIPIEIRRNLKLDKNDCVTINVEDNKIIISKQDNKEVIMLGLLIGNLLSFSFDNKFIVKINNEIISSNGIEEIKNNMYSRDILCNGIVFGNIVIYGDNVEEKDRLLIDKIINTLNDYLN